MREYRNPALDALFNFHDRSSAGDGGDDTTEAAQPARLTAAPEQGTTTIADVARDYIGRGWKPVAIPFKTKGPKGVGWPDRVITLDNVAEHFPGGPQNIGVQLGAVSHDLVDGDADCREAIATAPYIMPRTQALFGRKSSRGSHRLYYSPDLADLIGKAAFQFKDPNGDADKAMLCELRVGGGGKAAQTVFPGSTHPTGEAIKWETDGEPATCDGAALLKAGKRWAAASLIARYWPNIGARHDAALILGGFLARCGFTLQDAKLFCEAVAAAASADIKHTERCVTDAWNNYQRGVETIYGYPAFEKEFGKETAARVAEWLDFDRRERDQQYQEQSSADFDAFVSGVSTAPGELPGPQQTTPGGIEPEPIVIELLPVPVFDPEALLPKSLRYFVMDEAERMPCPPEFVAVATIVALGSVIGARCAMKIKERDNWLVMLNLWGGMVGDPSVKKSPAMEAALHALKRLVADAMDAHKKEYEGYEIDRKIFEMKIKKAENVLKAAIDKDGDIDGARATLLNIKRTQEPVKPILRRYHTDDCTIEKLGERLRENPTGILVSRDELVGLFASWGREGHEEDRSFFLSVWNGNQSYDTGRIGRGDIFIPNVCVSLFGGLTPDKLTVYLEEAVNSLGNDGMLQRLQMLVYPDPFGWKWVDRSPHIHARNDVFGIFKELANFDPVKYGAEPADDFCKFPYFRFDDEAQAAAIEWMVKLHKKIEGETDTLIQQHLAKYEKLLAGLALIFHLVECAPTQAKYQSGGKDGPVTKDALDMAIAWCDLLEAHARR
jgi:hypothetical protein